MAIGQLVAGNYAAHAQNSLYFWNELYKNSILSNLRQTAWIRISISPYNGDDAGTSHLSIRPVMGAVGHLTGFSISFDKTRRRFT
jgi:hypothetical protein